MRLRRRRPPERERPLLVHLTTVDMSLELLLGPQLRAFRDAGYDVVGVSAPGPYVAGLEADGIRHIALRHATRSMSLRSDLAALRELVSLFRRLQPDIVHTHNPKPGVYGRIAARIAGVPRIVNTVHGLYAQPTDPWKKRLVVYTLERIAATCSHAELVQNSEDLELLRRLRVPAKKLHLLGNGVDLTRFDPGTISEEDRLLARKEMGATGPNDVVIGCVARLVNEKGIPELVEAAELLAERCPNARFALIGPHDPSRDDDVSEAVIERAKQAGMALLGHRTDVERLYAGMDVFVLPSHREGFPRSVMEAAAMGVPAVVTDIRGCREAVRHGENGLLVEVMAPAQLADALAQSVDDTEAREQLSEGARAAARNRFDVRHQVAISRKCYREQLPISEGRRPA